MGSEHKRRDFCFSSPSLWRRRHDDDGYTTSPSSSSSSSCAIQDVRRRISLLFPYKSLFVSSFCVLLCIFSIIIGYIQVGEAQENNNINNITTSTSPYLIHDELGPLIPISLTNEYDPFSSSSPLSDPLSGGGHTPRRLSVSAAMINFATQVATSQEIRALMGQWTGMMGEIFRGVDTAESSLPFYWRLPECVLTVDFAAVMDVAATDSLSINIYYTPIHNAIVLTYKEEAAEWIQVLKRPIKRMQLLYLPAECMIDKDTINYSSFCTKPTGRCIVIRLDIQLTRITKQMINQLNIINNTSFINYLIKEEDLLYDDAVDVLEAQTTINRLLFDPLRCIMHARVHAMGLDKIFIYFNHQEHSLRVDAQNTDLSWYRRKVIIPQGCGGYTPEDFISTVYVHPDGTYKIIIKTLIARSTDLDRDKHHYYNKDIIFINKKRDIRPTKELKYGEHDPKDMYPDDHYIPLETMIVGHPY